MLIDEIRTLLRAQPFQPFFVHLTDGTILNIHHHDYAWLRPSGLALHLVDPQDKVHIINAAQIAKLSFEDTPTTTSSSS